MYWRTSRFGSVLHNEELGKINESHMELQQTNIFLQDNTVETKLSIVVQSSTFVI